MNPGSTALDELRRCIRSLAGASTADVIGIAPGSALAAEELGDLGSRFGSVQSVIVLAQRIVDPAQLVRFQSGGIYRDSRVATHLADAMLRDACWCVVAILHDGGYRAAIPRNLRYGSDEPRHQVSYTKAAVLAGLGTIGRSRLLIHPEWGPWVTLRIVITDAPLPPDVPIDFSPCDDCRLCIAACPAGALSENGFDRAACELFVGIIDASPRAVLRISPLAQINCEECMRACPVGTAPPPRLTIGAQRR